MTLLCRSALVVATATLSACVGQPVETHRLVTSAVGEVKRRVAAEMTALGLLVTTGDGVVMGRSDHAPTEWAACSPALVGRGGGEHTSRRFVSVSTREARVSVTLSPSDDGTSVDVMTTFSASYVNPEKGGTFDKPCRSKGFVEMRILEAAG
jgi:hypothetical protein